MGSSEDRPCSRFLSGNEAVAFGALDAGLAVAAAYPGTPSTEIVETLAAAGGVYAEWSVNEKVALEVAVGASMVGRRALTAMKHVGLNVAADTLMSSGLTGAGAGLVIAVADDVGRVLPAEPRLQVVVEPPRSFHPRHDHLMALRIE